MGVRDAIAKALAGRIKVFHSSPHDFERPSLDKIGTGQGAASYSPGFYVAESPAVSGQGGEYWQEFVRHPKISKTERDAADFLALHNFDRAKVAAQTRNQLDRNAEFAKGVRSPEELEALAAERLEFEKVVRLLESDKPVGPRTYEMEITTPRSSFLDWDKPLDQQPTKVWDRLDPKVRADIDEAADARGFNAMGDALDTYTGKDLYRVLSNHEIQDSLPAELGRFSAYRGDYDPAVHATEYLKSLDIPGVAYLDQHSRRRVGQIESAQQQLRSFERSGNKEALPWAREVLENVSKDPITSNYSVWDTDKLEVLKKYGIAGAGALPMGSLAASDQYEVQQ